MKTSITLPKKPQRARDLFITAFKISNNTLLYTLPFYIILVLLNYGMNVLSIWLQEAENLNNLGLVFVASLLVLVLLYFTFAMFASIIYRINAIVNHTKNSFNDCFLMGCTKAIPFIVVCFLYALIVSVGTLLLVIPGIMALTYFVFASYLVVLGYGIIESFKESFKLVKDNWWRTTINLILLSLAMILVVLIVYGLLIVFGIIVQLLIGAENELGLGFIVFATIVITVLLFLVYNYSISYILACIYDLQLRKGKK